MLSIGNPRDLEIAADPLSRDAVQTPREGGGAGGASGAATARSMPCSGRSSPLRRTEVSALGIEEQRVDAIFDITSPPETRLGLGDGYAVRLCIVVWNNEDVLRLPIGALFRAEGNWAVFAVRDGVAWIQAGRGRTHERP